MIFKNKLIDKITDALTQENARLRAENSKLQDKLLSFCSDSFARYNGVKLQEKQLETLNLKDSIMEKLGMTDPKNKEEEQERETAELELKHILGAA